MNIETARILELINVANQLALDRGNRELNEIEKEMLKQALQGKKLRDIQVGNYSRSTVERQYAPKLWRLLGEGVNVRNVRLALENVLAQSQTTIIQQEIQSDPLSTAIDKDTPVSDSPKRILHNLPRSGYSKFIGRREEVTKLFKLLSPDHAAHLICIAGIGGVGKTSLVVACARQCLHASCNPDAYPNIPIFDAIIFTTAKQQYLTYAGVRHRRDPNQNDIVRQIIEVLDSYKLIDNNVEAVEFEAQVALIYKALLHRRTLLIVDNLETVENKQDISDFLYDLPSSVKAVITTREGIDGIPIRLNTMPELDALNLVQYQAGEMGVSLQPEDSQTLYQITSGLPIAIDYAIGQLAFGYSIREIKARIPQSTGDVARFCFENSVRPLQNRPAYWLLIAMALFPAPVLREALVEVAIPDIDSHTAEDATVQLQTLSLIIQEHSMNGKSSRYCILPLTREYVLAELKSHPMFEQEARKRWVNWYLSFSRVYSKQNTGTWQGQFEELEEEWQNLQAVADWCIANNRYSEMLQLWQNLKPYTYVIGRRANRISCWNSSLTWANWIEQSASQRGDRSVVAQSLFDVGWMLVATGKPKPLEEADSLLKQAWDLHQHQDLKQQINLSRCIAILKIKQQQFDEAQKWLKQSEELLQSAELSDRKQAEYLSQTRYYQGMAYLRAGKIDISKRFFEEARNYARLFKLERLVQVSETALADVAVQQGELVEAQQLLKEGLAIATANADQCRVAFIKQSFAKLAKAQGNFPEAQYYAIEALEAFDGLGMLAEVDEVQNFIDCELLEEKPAILSSKSSASNLTAS